MQTFCLKHKYMNGDTMNWDVSWELLDFEFNHHELRIRARGSSFDVVLGQYLSGYYLCIPAIGVGCNITFWSDVFWNTERLSCLLSETDAATIAAAINHYGNYNCD